MPRLSPAIADMARVLTPRDYTKLVKRVDALQEMFPQLVLQVVIHHFPDEHPLSMHAFWLFNAGNFAGDSCRGKLNRSLLLAIDPKRSEAAIIPGYGLEPSLTPETLKHLLELASPSWADHQWAAGVLRVLDGLEQLLTWIGVPIRSGEKIKGEY